jgi:hypothetical protein
MFQVTSWSQSCRARDNSFCACSCVTCTRIARAFLYTRVVTLRPLYFPDGRAAVFDVAVGIRSWDLVLLLNEYRCTVFCTCVPISGTCSDLTLVSKEWISYNCFMVTSDVITFLSVTQKSFQRFRASLTNRRTLPAHLHTCTPAHMHTCTPARLHTCTPARLHACTPPRTWTVVRMFWIQLYGPTSSFWLLTCFPVLRKWHDHSVYV